MALPLEGILLLSSLFTYTPIISSVGKYLFLLFKYIKTEINKTNIITKLKLLFFISKSPKRP